MSEPEKEKVKFEVVPFEWALEELAKPTLKEVGLDLKDGYVALKSIAKNAFGKNNKDGLVNKRVAIEVLRSGGFIETDIGVEYFGGILAQAKTTDGKDDSGMYYTEVVKSLSSNQLRLHYVIYNSLQKLFVNDQEKYSSMNIGMETELQKHRIYFVPAELEQCAGSQLDKNIFVLVQSGLLGSTFRIDSIKENEQIAKHYAEFTPTALGIQLYASAYGRVHDWRNFNKVDFGNFENITLPSVFSSSKDDLPGIEFTIALLTK